LPVSAKPQADLGVRRSVPVAIKAVAFGQTCLGGLLMLVGLGLYAFGALDLLQTSLIWLRTGNWVANPTAGIVDRFISSSNLRLWLQNPSDWIGLHRLIEVACLRWPWFATSIVYGTVLSACGMSMWLKADETEQDWLRTRENESAAIAHLGEDG
jgi:hypothetical protein